jgi:glycosyltransferase involved in cell wall biosynthesis
MPAEPDQLKILHVLRAPVGGLFRHVVDLARGQAAAGHAVGIVADSRTGGERAHAILSELAPHLALGLERFPMSRHAGISDVTAIAAVARFASDRNADVVHGHGAKGGAYARLLRPTRALRVYTPHGGSLHYDWHSPAGLFYLTAERLLLRRSDLVLFESAYARDTFVIKVGAPPMARVVHNGVTPAEFAPVAPNADATDVVFVGELRALKGIDMLIDALALAAREGRRVTATVVGEGPDRAALVAKAGALGLASAIHFAGALPARTAFALGRILVVPSRAESLPYVVLEAAAAQLPVIATRVGGIPEIFGPDAADLVPAADAAALAGAIVARLRDPAVARDTAVRLHARVSQHFSSAAMTAQVIAAYREALRARHR